MTRRTALQIAGAAALALVVGGAMGYLLAPSSGDHATALGRAVEGEIAGGAGTDAAGRKILYWRAPMDPNYRRDKPGKSPMGMDLIPVYADEADADGGRQGVVRIDPAIVASLGVRTGRAELGVLPRNVRTVGYVGFDEDSLHHVHVRVEGWIESLAARAVGDTVKAGEMLFELYSPTLVNAQEEFLAALESGNRPLRAASTARLQALGVTAGEIARLERDRRATQRVRVLAHQDGVVVSLGVRHGMYITPMTEVMSIAAFDRVWILADVLEREAGWVSAGDPVEVTLDALPGAVYRGAVDYVYPELDPKTRTLRVRVRFDNPDGVLRPNMLADVRIAAAPGATVVHVPRAAVIRDGHGDRVVVAQGDGRFRSQRVELGIESGDRFEIASGLEAGVEIVTSAQFLIDSESNVDVALSRLSAERSIDHAHDAPAHATPEPVSGHGAHAP